MSHENYPDDLGGNFPDSLGSTSTYNKLSFSKLLKTKSLKGIIENGVASGQVSGYDPIETFRNIESGEPSPIYVSSGEGKREVVFLKPRENGYVEVDFSGVSTESPSEDVAYMGDSPIHEALFSSGKMKPRILDHMLKWGAENGQVSGYKPLIQHDGSIYKGSQFIEVNMGKGESYVMWIFPDESGNEVEHEVLGKVIENPTS